jgi:hypothetical protein
MNAPDDQYLLLWKGRQSGPFSLEQIRGKLYEGEISRIHQMCVNGAWQLVDDFFERIRQSELEGQQAEEQSRHEADLNRQYELRLAQEQERTVMTAPAPTFTPAGDERSPLSHLLPPSSPPPPPPPTFTPTYLPHSSPHADIAPVGFGAPPPPFVDLQSRTSGLAVTALVMGICTLIPFVNGIAWIPGIICGHMALSQMKRDSSLKGKGMAVAGLIITYVMLVLGIGVLTYFLVMNKPIGRY